MRVLYFYRLLVLSLLLSGTGFQANAQVDAPGQVWQWAVDVRGSLNGIGISRAYMWIPPNASSVVAMVFAQNNMEELSIVENQQFRDSMASVNIGIVWASPNYDINFNFQNGAGDVFLNLMNDLAVASGYAELKNVPVIPMGHSAAANVPAAFAAWSNERTLCGVSVSGMAPYDFTNLFGENTWCGRRLDYIPHLMTSGEYEGAGDIPNASWSRIFTRVDTNQFTPFSFLPCSGEFHFATSQRKTNFIANFIKKALHYRLVTPATATSLAVLNPINPMTTGWRVDRWQKNMPPRYAPAPVTSYTGIRAESNWCFDEDMAIRIEDFKQTYFRKTPCLLAYNQSTVAGVVGPQVPQNNNHVQVRLNFYPLNDSLDFELSSSFLDTIPAVSGRCASWMSTTNPVTGAIINGVVGAAIGKPADNSLSVIDREIGPLEKLRKDPVTGITTFRMTMERGIASTITNYSNTAIFSVAHPGDAIYKASVLQAEIGIPVYNTIGLAQTINFPPIPDVSRSNLAPIALTATSSIGMPVQYWVEEGPVQIVGGNIVFTAIPPSTVFPMRVIIGAWQWGRDAGLAARTAGTGAVFPGQQVQSATPMQDTFYIIDGTLPVTLSSFKAKLINEQVAITWRTAAELNSKQFVVERSVNRSAWSTVGTIAANGMASSYNLLDTAPFDGINYYRLKTVDADGRHYYSVIVPVEFKKKAIKITKIGNWLTVSGGREKELCAITVYNAIGMTVYTKVVPTPSSQVVTTQIPKLATGIYMINVTTGTSNETLKVLAD